MQHLNNQTPNYNNQIIINNQIPITKHKSLVIGGLDIGIYLVIGNWLLVISYNYRNYI